MIELWSDVEVLTQYSVLGCIYIWCREKSKLVLQSCCVKVSCCLFKGKSCFWHQIVCWISSFFLQLTFLMMFFLREVEFLIQHETDNRLIESVRTMTRPYVSMFLKNSLLTNLCTIFDCNSYLLWKKCRVSFLHNVPVVCSMYFSSPFFAEHENFLQPILSFSFIYLFIYWEREP